MKVVFFGKGSARSSKSENCTPAAAVAAAKKRRNKRRNIEKKEEEEGREFGSPG